MPVRLMDCGLSPALSMIVRAPALVPVVAGLNVTPMVQLAPAAKPVPQLFVSRKSPLESMLVMFRVALPMLVRLTFWAGALVVPTA